MTIGMMQDLPHAERVLHTDIAIISSKRQIHVNLVILSSYMIRITKYVVILY